MREDHDDEEEEKKDPRPSDNVSLGEARAWLRARVKKGAICPLCHQHAKIYDWPLYARVVKALYLLYRAGGAREFVHGPTVLRGVLQGGDVGKLAYHGLVKEEKQRRDDGGRSGWWMVTELGVAFLRGEARLHKYARIYDGRVLRHHGPETSIGEVLPAFRLDDHMNRPNDDE